MKRRMLVLAMAVLATACRSLPFPDPHLDGEYGHAVKKWTRTVAVYSGLETRAFARVIYLSPEFTTAQAAEISRMRAELPDQAAATLARMREENKVPSFFAVVYVADKNANDWNELRSSVWRIVLNEGLGEHAPDKVERFERPLSAELKVLYPYLDEYSIAYLLHFPQTPATSEKWAPSQVHFKAAGAPGSMRFYWQLDGAQEPPSSGEGGPAEHPAESPK